MKLFNIKNMVLIFFFLLMSLSGCLETIPSPLCPQNSTCLISTFTNLPPTEVLETPYNPDPTQEIPVPTKIPSFSITPASTPTLRVDPTRIVPWPSGLPELLSNAKFNGKTQVSTICGYDPNSRQIECESHSLPKNWAPAYLALHYLWEDPLPPNPCSEEAQTSCNDSQSRQGRPEYKIATEAEGRAISGTSVQWFSQFRTSTAGIYQILEVPKYSRCQLSFRVMIWSAGGSDPIQPWKDRYEARGLLGWIENQPIYGEPFTSDLSSEDDRASAEVFLVASTIDSSNELFSESNIISRKYGFEDGIYDQFNEPLVLEFDTLDSSSPILIGIIVKFMWPNAHNNAYIENASLTCLGE